MAAQNYAVGKKYFFKIKSGGKKLIVNGVCVNSERRILISETRPLISWRRNAALSKCNALSIETTEKYYVA